MQNPVRLVFWILILSSTLIWKAESLERHKIRHVGCNFRFIRELMRRACAYHSSENELLDADLDNGDLASRSISTDGEYHETGRHKMDVELFYIRRILKECCPHDKCPPLSKFCL